jgi:inositol polyphosphate 1-phosphatase
MKVPAQSLLQALINASEKGALIARVIRAESALLELLVQEKKGDTKNYRFVQDFKTLADVLVQETVRHDLSQQVVVVLN